MNSEYLLFNCLILGSSLLGPLVYKGGKFPHIFSALASIIPVAFVYIFWDALVTDIWWSFNPLYTLGIIIGPLPIEEILFFFTVPWGCLVLWVNAKHHFPRKIFLVPLVARYGSVLLFFIVGVYAYVNRLWYLFSVFILCGFLLSFFFLFRKGYISSVAMIFTGIVIGLTVIFNGYLTARPIVIYDSAYMSGIRIFSMPIEDLFYGFSLLWLVIWGYEWIQSIRSVFYEKE